MKCTVLVDNQLDPARANLQNEHGLSLLVETEANAILFDSGASDLFSKNSKELGIDLQKVDAAVLSHGHYDHGGGLAAFLSMNNKAKVYSGPGAFETHVAKFLGILSKDIGLNRKALEPFAERMVTVNGMKEIAPGIYALADIPIVHKAPRDIGMFYKKPGPQLQKDDFAHEMILVMVERDGITALTGCAHKGILNIVSTIEKHFPNMPIEVLIGGLHMTNPATKRLSEKADDIRLVGRTLNNDVNLKKLFAGHCTGAMAYSLLQQEMGSKVQPLMVGRQIAF